MRIDQANNLDALNLIAEELRYLQNEDKIYKQSVMKELVAISTALTFVLTSVFDPDNQFLPFEFVMLITLSLVLKLVETACPELQNRGDQLQQLASQCNQKKTRIQLSYNQNAVGS